MIHDENKVGALRASAKAGIKVLDELRDKTTDSGFHEMLVPLGTGSPTLSPFSFHNSKAEMTGHLLRKRYC